MKLREFFNVEGFDPRMCGSLRYYDEKNNPVCPLACAAKLRGFTASKDTSAMSEIIDQFHLPLCQVIRFVNEWDRNHNAFHGQAKSQIFKMALNYSERNNESPPQI